MKGDRRWFSRLTPVITKEYITFGDNEKGRVLSVGTVKVSECDSYACFSCQVFGVQSCFGAQLLDEGFEVRFKMGLLVFWILEVILCARSSPRVTFSKPIFLNVSALLVVWLLVFR
jgi:hypothetical protein